MKEKKLKIFHLPFGENATNTLRVENLARVVNQQELAEFHIFDEADEWSDSQIKKAIRESDLILARELPTKMMLLIRDNYPRKRVIYDLDDNPWEVLPSSSHYKTMGTEDVVIETEHGDRPLWVTGITKGFNKYHNMWNLQQTDFHVRQADLVTVPNNRLAKLIASDFQQDVTVIPFYIDFDQYPDIEVKDRTKGKDEFRIVWNGGSSHGQDLNTIKKALGRVLSNDKDIKYINIGYWHKPFEKELPEKQVIKREWVKTDVLPYVLKSYDADVAIIPLSDVQHFNQFKSPMKFLEYAALKIPMIVKNDLPYSELADNGKNCLTYDTPEDLEKAIKKLKGDKVLRAKLTSNAYTLAKKFSLQDNAKNIIKLYSDFVQSYKKVTK